MTEGEIGDATTAPMPDVSVDASDPVGPDPVDEVMTNSDLLRAEASRASELAFTLRAAIDETHRELDRLDHERDARRRAIEEELSQARDQMAATMASIRSEVDVAQGRLQELRRTQAEIGDEVAKLGQTKDVILAQLSGVQERLRDAIPAIEELQNAQRALCSALATSSEEESSEEENGEDEGRHRRPLGRIMDTRETS